MGFTIVKSWQASVRAGRRLYLSLRSSPAILDGREWLTAYNVLT